MWGTEFDCVDEQFLIAVGVAPQWTTRQIGRFWTFNTAVSKSPAVRSQSPTFCNLGRGKDNVATRTESFEVFGS